MGRTGTDVANMVILAALDLVHARRRILHAVAAEHALLGLPGIVLVAIAGAAVLVGGLGRVGHVGLETLAIGGIYVGGMRLVYRSAPAAPPPETVVTDMPPLGGALAGFGLGTLGLLALAPCLMVSAEALALESGITATFVGTLWTSCRCGSPSSRRSRRTTCSRRRWPSCAWRSESWRSWAGRGGARARCGWRAP